MNGRWRALAHPPEQRVHGLLLAHTPTPRQLLLAIPQRVGVHAAVEGPFRQVEAHIDEAEKPAVKHPGAITGIFQGIGQRWLRQVAAVQRAQLALQVAEVVGVVQAVGGHVRPAEDREMVLEADTVRCQPGQVGHRLGVDVGGGCGFELNENEVAGFGGRGR